MHFANGLLYNAESVFIMEVINLAFETNKGNERDARQQESHRNC
jgi:hypothetical protein